MKLRTLDLFSGIGGFSLGLERTGGFETVAFCEIDKKARLVLRKHWKDVPIFEDVTTLKGDQLGTIDVICGGFPCQDISLAGKGAGLEGARSGLWWQFHRLIKETHPQWVIAENVSALRSRGLDTVLRSLSEIGYDAEWHCIPASAVGAPHQRDRIWIVAYPQLHGLSATSVSGSIEETIRKEQARQDNSLDIEGASSISTTDKNVANPHDSGSGTPEHGTNQDGQKTQQRWEFESLSRISGCSTTMANTHSNDGRDGSSPEPQGWESRVELGSGSQRQLERNASQELGNPDKFGTQVQTEREYPSKQVLRGSSEAWRATVGEYWRIEPEVGRVANGVSGRVDRLKQLGNAVVPQIPELIGRAILEAQL